jgi:hypothetical protein
MSYTVRGFFPWNHYGDGIQIYWWDVLEVLSPTKSGQKMAMCNGTRNVLTTSLCMILSHHDWLLLQIRIKKSPRAHDTMEVWLWWWHEKFYTLFQGSPEVTVSPKPFPLSMWHEYCGNQIHSRQTCIPESGMFLEICKLLLIVQLISRIWVLRCNHF